MIEKRRREVTKIHVFDPKIDEVELVKVSGEEVMRLAIEGVNLSGTIIQEKCTSQFDFPFKSNEVNVKESSNSQNERIVFETPMKEDYFNIFLSNLNAEVSIVTVFGECTERLEESNIRTIQMESVGQV